MKNYILILFIYLISNIYSYTNNNLLLSYYTGEPFPNSLKLFDKENKPKDCLLDTSNKDKQSLNKTKEINLGNFTIIVNQTSDSNNTDCIPECYLNCQMHFDTVKQQKYCVINICHCKILQNQTQLIDSTNTDFISEIQILEQINIENGNEIKRLKIEDNEDAIEADKNSNSTISADEAEYHRKSHLERHYYRVLLFAFGSFIVIALVILGVGMYNNYDKDQTLQFEDQKRADLYSLIEDDIEQEKFENKHN